jgi:hypothetical protein
MEEEREVITISVRIKRYGFILKVLLAPIVQGDVFCGLRLIRTFIPPLTIGEYTISREMTPVKPAATMN